MKNIVERGVKHHSPNPNIVLVMNITGFCTLKKFVSDRTVVFSGSIHQ